MDVYENYEEGAYCEGCDDSYSEDALRVVPVGQWNEIFVCPHGHVYPGVFLNEYYWEVGTYLLNIADDDYAWPCYTPPLPAYGG